MNLKPSIKQVEFLKRLAIEPHPTKKGSNMFINYIRNAEGHEDVIRKRIRTIQVYQKRWIGKKVQHRESGVEGVVVFLSLVSIDELVDFRNSHPEQDFFHPLKAMVHYDNAVKKFTYLGYLQRLPKSSNTMSTP